MPKDKPEKPQPVPDPPKPIDKDEKDKKEKETKVKTKKLKLLEGATVPVEATITAGTWVAEIDNANVRRNTLRLGDM